MKRVFFILLLLFPLIGNSQIKRNWINELDDDFSFIRDWEYHEGIYMNQWGQLSCDGFCPEEIDPLTDDQGRIYDDSLTKFYSLVDTTHRYFSHEGFVQAYAYSECNHASAKKVDGKIHIETEMNIATHTALHIIFDPNIEHKENPLIRAYLIYYNIRATDPVEYPALNGFINISPQKLDEGIIQMSFDLKFESDKDDEDLQYWEGKIYTPLLEE